MPGSIELYCIKYKDVYSVKVYGTTGLKGIRCLQSARCSLSVSTALHMSMCMHDIHVCIHMHEYEIDLTQKIAVNNKQEITQATI